MRAIYSLYAKHSTCAYRNYDELLESLSLSSLVSSLHFDEVILYCDAKGYSLVKERKSLLFGFTEILQVLPEDLVLTENNEWALPKVHTYSLQDAPFIHIDIDVILWDGLPKEVLNKRFIFQNIETYKDPAYSFYPSTYRLLNSSGMLPSYAKNDGFAYNMGIFGVTQASDLMIIKEHHASVIEYLHKFREWPNRLKYFGGPSGSVNCCMFEQCFMTNILTKYGVAKKEIGLILNSDWSKIYKDLNYSHFASENKRDIKNIETIRKSIPVYRSRYVSKRASQILSIR